MIRKILIEKGYDLYIDNDKPEVLADKVLSAFFGRKPIVSDLPINPYKIMVSAGAYYVILDFENLEGFFLPPGENEKYSKIGLKLDTLPERRRFSAAHELCHHLKDVEMRETIQGSNDPVEVFANQFATHLLMPEHLVKEIIDEYQITKENFDLNKVMDFSLRFAVSFQSAFICLNRTLNLGLSSNDISKQSKKYKPSKRKEILTKDGKYMNNLYKEIIENYHFTKFQVPVKTKNDFLRFVVTNDHLIENGKVTKERISEIISLLRIKPATEVAKHFSLDTHEREVVGQYLMYQYIFNSKFQTEMQELKNLHKKFCSVAIFPEFGGYFRDVEALITGTNVKTSSPRIIEIDLIDLFDKYSLNSMLAQDNISIIETILNIHHGITVIHPFPDGNGRISRALMNFQLLEKNISPFFISYEKIKKREYYEGLRNCDENGNKYKLENYIYKNIIEMYSTLLPNNISFDSE